VIRETILSLTNHKGLNMNRYTVQYSKLNTECSLCGVITVTLFADSKEEVEQVCSDLYDACNGDFRIIKVSLGD